MEFNKIFAAILVAGIITGFSGFIAGQIIPPYEVEADTHAVAAKEAKATASKKKKAAEPVLGLIAAADVERGKKLSRACASCHSFNKGGPGKIGPNLWDIVNHDKADVDGYSYSNGMKKAGGKWTMADLNKFLWKPKSLVPETKMGFAGIKKQEDRAALIAWMRSLADSPVALPTADEIKAE